jgi:hypothetical protein
VHKIILKKYQGYALLTKRMVAGVDVMITFSAIFANFRRKNGVFSKTNVMIKCLQKLAVV